MRFDSLARACSYLVAGALLTTSVGSAPLIAAATPSPTFAFSGGGWGHGIGLSQYGARGYALRGWKYNAILAHYYKGTRLVTKPSAKIRVDIEDGKASRSRWKIKAGSSTALTIKQTSNSTVYITLSASKSYWITTSGGNTQVRADSSGQPGSVLKSFSGECFASAGGLVQVLDSSGPFNHTGVRWRGTIHFKPTTSSSSRAINYVNLEEYLYGVVPRESPSSWPTEALKAQAVAARSYAYQNAVDKDVIYCTTMSQVYNGHSRRSGGREYAHEAASTNSAVDSTTGRLVWYGSETKPVRTYFSASSGGHTANIEDVWGGSAKPYYTGVADADESSPYYRWSAGPFSATHVAEKLRALDIARGGGLEYSVAAPAVVTGITTERSTSGYTRYATVTWSNGKRYRIQGTTLQSALRLRSSKYGVTSTYPAVNKTRYQETDTRLAWDGKWRGSTSSKLSGRRMMYSSTAGSSLSARFTGNGFVWVSKRSPYHGIAAIYVDGRYVKTIDQYSSKTKYGQVIYSTSSLAPGTHTLEIKVAGRRRSKAKGARVAVDAIDVVNGNLAQASPKTRTYEQDHARLARIGTWSVVSDNSASHGTEVRSNSTAAAFYATFYGSKIEWIATTGAPFGRAKVSVDGAPAKEVVLNGSTTKYRQVVYSAGGLSPSRTHLIRIQPVGQPSGGTEGMVSVDSLRVTGGWLLPASLPPSIFADTDARIRWTGAWKTATGRKYYGRSHRYASSSSAAATVRFEGTGIRWIDRTSPKYGKMRVYLDGKYKGTVDQYSRRTAYRRTLWDSGVLPCGIHTLELRPAAKRSRSSKGVTVGVDAFRVSGRLLPR